MSTKWPHGEGEVLGVSRFLSPLEGDTHRNWDSTNDFSEGVLGAKSHKFPLGARRFKLGRDRNDPEEAVFFSSAVASSVDT